MSNGPAPSPTGTSRRSATARRAAVRGIRRASLLFARRYVDDAGTCLVLAPHSDAESIGCGGTIAIKRSKGLRVVVAVVTDGSLSVSQGQPPAELAVVRQAEALAACAELGVPP